MRGSEKKMDEKKIEEGVRLILEGIGEDITRPGLKDTPLRVVSMYKDILSGINQNPSSVFVTLPEEKFESCNNLVIFKDISFYSLCEHHLMPFFGRIDVHYLPANNRIVGLSKVIKLINILSNRLQIQERLTEELADVIMNSLKPKGVFIKIKAMHLCLAMRGVKKENTMIITTTRRGSLR